MSTSVFRDTMVLENWQTIEKAGAEKRKVLFPIGVIEEHGPHIPLGSDILWSCAMCRMVREKLSANGCKSVIAPPYYWGVNYCTGAFPGSFSLKPETMRLVLLEIFENLKGFGFSEIYCFNYHGDSKHIHAITDAAKEANETLGIHVRLVLEAMDLPLHGWKGDEDFLLVSDPKYPMEWFEEQDPAEAGLLDIHGGAFETAVLQHLYPELVDLEKAKTLPSSSLNRDGMKKWLQGGESTREVVPLGYAGNPAGYEAVSRHVEEMLELQAEDIAGRIICI